MTVCCAVGSFDCIYLQYKWPLGAPSHPRLTCVNLPPWILECACEEHMNLIFDIPNYYSLTITTCIKENTQKEP